MKLRFSAEARSELLRIGDYIARDSPTSALGVVRGAASEVQALALMPLAFPFVPRFERLGLRRRVVGNYLIFYRIEADVVFVMNIIHGARDYEALLDRHR